MSTPPTTPKKLPIARLVIAAVVLLAIAALIVQIVGWRETFTKGHALYTKAMETVTNAGPAVFFGAMALLPIFGVPMMAFTLPAGVLFAARLGFMTVLILGLAAITLNLTVTYWLARRWLRPFFTRLLARFGYKLPEVQSGDATDLIVLLRVTPGVPFFVQNYLLGLAEVPFGRYLAISCAIQWTLNVAFMLLGDALTQGRGKVILFAILLLAALSVGTHLVRKHLGKKNAVG